MVRFSFFLNLCPIMTHPAIIFAPNIVNTLMDILNVTEHKEELAELVNLLISSRNDVISLNCEDMAYLFAEKCYLKRRYFSFPMKGERRLASIIREIKELEPIDLRQFTSCIARIETSSEQPVLMEELGDLISLINLLNNDVKFIWSYGTSPKITDDKCMILLVLSK